MSSSGTHSNTNPHSRAFHRPAAWLAAGLKLAPRELVSFAGQVFLLMGVYFVLIEWITRTAALPAESYTQPIILIDMLGHPLITIPALLLIIPLAVFRSREIWDGWRKMEYGRELRILIGITAGMCAWVFSTYDYNLYFNQAHLFDRFFLVFLAALVIWKPLFVLPFSLYLYTIVAQFDQPLAGQYPWTEMNLIIRILTLFAASVLVQIITRQRRRATFLFVLFCLIASFYWISGLGKYRLDWISHRQLHLVMLGAYANGWLGFLQPSQVVSLVEWFSQITLPMMVFVLLVEWGAVFILLKREVSLAILAGFILFHLGTFILSGMFFWKWVVVEVTLIVLFFWKKDRPALPVFKPGYFLISLLLIGGSGYWFRPSNLSWYDTRLSYSYRYEGVAESGTRYPLSIHTFDPYADMFTLGNFGYLNPNPQITNIWGITQRRSIAEDLLRVHTPAEVTALEATYPRVQFEAGHSALFDEFIRGSIRTLNERGPRRPIWQYLQAPRHLWSFPQEPVFQGQEALEKVNVYQLTWLYDDEQFSVIRKNLIREIEVGGGEE